MNLDSLVKDKNTADYLAYPWIADPWPVLLVKLSPCCYERLISEGFKVTNSLTINHNRKYFPKQLHIFSGSYSCIL